MTTENDKQPATGRAPSNPDAVGHIHLRTSLEQKGRYTQAARLQKGRNLAEWIMDTCDQAAEAQLGIKITRKKQDAP
jgi:hypothetical protein